MQWKGLMIALTGLSVLCVTGCGSSRNVVRESADLRTTELRSSEVRDCMMVAVHDTIMETVTITVDRNEAGDTVFTSVVTERDRIRNRDRVRDNHEKTVIRNDTVLVEWRDSTRTSRGSSRASPFLMRLKWVGLVIVLGLIVLGIVLKIKT
jgi:hypothetical protein